MAIRNKSICPPGVFCITPGILILLLVLCIVGVFVVYEMRHMQQQDKQPMHISVNTPPSSVVVDDGRYSMAPRPQRIWNMPAEIPTRGALVPPDGGYILNQPTRGFPESYQPMGVLKTNDGQLLPLYGRRTAYRSDRFNYYTRTDTNNPIPLPIQSGRRDCQDDIGCDELLGGENIHIAGIGKEGHVEVYKYDGPKYIPGIV